MMIFIESCNQENDGKKPAIKKRRPSENIFNVVDAVEKKAGSKPVSSWPSRTVMGGHGEEPQRPCPPITEIESCYGPSPSFRLRPIHEVRPEIADRILSSQEITSTSVDTRNSRDTIPIPENWFMSRNSSSHSIGNFGT